MNYGRLAYEGYRRAYKEERRVLEMPEDELPVWEELQPETQKMWQDTAKKAWDDTFAKEPSK